MRRLGVIILAAALAGCGFTPMYGATEAGSSLTRIAVSTPDDRLGYRLREQLEDALAFDRSAAPQYRGGLRRTLRWSRARLARPCSALALLHALAREVLADACESLVGADPRRVAEISARRGDVEPVRGGQLFDDETRQRRFGFQP